jgi:hypothetical protein
VTTQPGSRPRSSLAAGTAGLSADGTHHPHTAPEGEVGPLWEGQLDPGSRECGRVAAQRNLRCGSRAFAAPPAMGTLGGWASGSLSLEAACDQPDEGATRTGFNNRSRAGVRKERQSQGQGGRALGCSSAPPPQWRINRPARPGARVLHSDGREGSCDSSARGRRRPLDERERDPERSARCLSLQVSVPADLSADKLRVQSGGHA